MSELTPEKVAAFLNRRTGGLTAQFVMVMNGR